MELNEIRNLTPETGGYEYRRGYIAVRDSNRGEMECLSCGVYWFASIRPMSGGQYYRGSWTCYQCGANSKGAFSGEESNVR